MDKPGGDELEKMYRHQEDEIKSRSEWGVIIRDKVHYFGLATIVIGLFLFAASLFVPVDTHGNLMANPEDYYWQRGIGILLMVSGGLVYLFTKN